MLTQDQIDAIVSWMDGADVVDHEDTGRHREVCLPEELFQALVKHLHGIGPLRDVVSAAREWIRIQDEEKHGRYLDGFPGELVDAIEALDGKEQP